MKTYNARIGAISTLKGFSQTKQNGSGSRLNPTQRTKKCLSFSRPSDDLSSRSLRKHHMKRLLATSKSAEVCTSKAKRLRQ